MFPTTEYENISIRITSRCSIIQLSYENYASHTSHNCTYAYLGLHLSAKGKWMPFRICNNRENILYHRALYQEHPFMCNVYSVEFVSLLTNGLC